MAKSYENPLLYRPQRGLPERVAVIGAGTIGPDIAYYLKSAIPALTLYLVDVRQEALDAAQERFAGYVEKGLKRGKLAPERAADVRERVVPTLDYERIADSDWVIEAATEDLPLKRRIFDQVEALVSPETIMTSNTSSIPAARIFSELKHPQRTSITHFFAPAFRNPVVEVIDWEQGSREVLEYLRWAFCVTGKLPLVTRDVPCFMLDRIFDNWCNEAAYLLEAASAAEIDSVAAEFVHAGPFFVLNMANGNPIIVETNTLQAEEEGDHYRPAPIFRSVAKWQTLAVGRSIEVEAVRAASVRDRLLGILFSQSVDILDREIGAPADLDLGSRLAFGLKKGPLELMRERSADELQRIFTRLAAERPGMPMPRGELAHYQQFRRHLLVDDLDGVLLLTIRRPEALNALHDEITDEILALIRAQQDDPSVQGFIITGYGDRAFSAGADIGRFPSMLGDAEAAAVYSRECSRLLLHLDQMAKPVVAAVNGMALGGGLELAMRCHALVAVKDAWFQFPEIRLGIVPGIGGMVVPYRRWPQAAERFHAMLCRAAKINAADAAQAGIVAALAEDFHGLIDAARERVRALSGAVPRIPDGPVEVPALDPALAGGGSEGLSAEVLAILAEAVRAAAAAGSLAEALEIGYRAFGRSACTAAAREGISAFQERRKPDFDKTG